MCMCPKQIMIYKSSTYMSPSLSVPFPVSSYTALYCPAPQNTYRRYLSLCFLLHIPLCSVLPAPPPSLPPPRRRRFCVTTPPSSPSFPRSSSQALARAADVDVRRELVSKAKVGAAVTDHAERRLVLAPRVLAAPVLHVHHGGGLVRQAEGRPRVAWVPVHWVPGAGGVLATGSFHVDHAPELMLRAIEGSAVAFDAEVGVGLAACWEFGCDRDTERWDERG